MNFLFPIFVAFSAEAGEKIRLTGSQLTERIGGYEVIAGASDRAPYHYMLVAYSSGTREVYWNDGIKSGTDTGTHRIEGDISILNAGGGV